MLAGVQIHVYTTVGCGILPACLCVSLSLPHCKQCDTLPTVKDCTWLIVSLVDTYSYTHADNPVSTKNGAVAYYGEGQPCLNK